MPSLGDEFRSAREARGLSLSDVAERLHIRSVYLGAIEDEDWKAIGAPVYIRGFMRTYARFLGLDAEAAVARFAATSGTVPPTAPSRIIEERPREGSGEAGRPSAFAIVAVLAAIAVVIYVAYSYAQNRPAATVPVATLASPGVDAEAPAIASSPDAAALAEPSGPPPAAKPLHAGHPPALRLALTQTSWLRVAIDGKVMSEGTFPAGTTKSYTGKTADVRVGNAGGVDLTINGRPVGKLGNDGDVVERQFVLSGE